MMIYLPIYVRSSPDIFHAKVAGVCLMEHIGKSSQIGSGQNQFVVQEEKFVFHLCVFSYFIM